MTASPPERCPTWQPIQTAPEFKPVQTKIDDEHGCRNEQVMTRRGRLWWIGKGETEMYVYYTPTHWRPDCAGTGQRKPDNEPS